jgi:hypothetical protein
LAGQLKGDCPVCHRHNYGEWTLKEHLLANHQGPILVHVILDLLDALGNLRAAVGDAGAHNSWNCILCRKQQQAGMEAA